MVDAAAATEWQELYQLMVQHYPDLPLHEAYVELRDAFIRFPHEVRNIVTPVVPRPPEEVLDTMAAIGDFMGWNNLTRLLDRARSDRTNQELRAIVTELKRFNNPNLYGQIADINALLTSNAAV